MLRQYTLTPLLPLKPAPGLLQGYVTRAQLAQTYKVSPPTIWRWQRRDGLPVHRIGTQPVYILEEVAAWFAARPNNMHGRAVWLREDS